MVKIEKDFDAVKTMRSIRDRLSDQFQGMTWEEEDRYIRDHVTFIQLSKGTRKLPNKGMKPMIENSCG